MKKTLLTCLAIGAIANLTAQNITDDLVFHLDGDEAITMNVDGNFQLTSTLGGVDGVISPLTSTLTQTTGADGTPNGALDIPADGYIDFDAAAITDLPVGAVTSRTLSAWVKYAGADNANVDVFSYGSTTNGLHVHFNPKAGGSFNFGHWNYDFLWSGLDIGDDAWHHIAVVMTDGAPTPEATLYIDNVSMGAEPYTGSTVLNTTLGTNSLRVGGRNGSATGTAPGNPYNGEVDDVRIYNRSLTAADVAALYTANGGVLSTSNVDKVADFRVFPTVASDRLEVQSRVDMKNLSIVNLNGVKIKSIQANKEVNVSDLSSGLYFIVGESNTGLSTVKFVKK